MSIEQIVKYFHFVFDFLVNPQSALSGFSGSGSLEIALGDFLLNGIVLITGITLAIEKATRFDAKTALGELPGWMAYLYMWFPWMLRFPLLGPLAFFLITAAGTQYLHWSYVGSREVLELIGVNLTYLEGSWQDTFNGLMGFYSVIYPVFAALVAGSLGVLLVNRTWGVRFMAALISVAYLSFAIYFPLSISAVHPGTSYWEVWLAGFATLPLVMSVYFVGYLAEKGYRIIRG